MPCVMPKRPRHCRGSLLRVNKKQRIHRRRSVGRLRPRRDDADRIGLRDADQIRENCADMALNVAIFRVVPTTSCGQRVVDG